MSSQSSFLRSHLFWSFTQESRRADIFNFSPYISHLFVRSSRQGHACQKFRRQDAGATGGDQR